MKRKKLFSFAASLLFPAGLLVGQPLWADEGGTTLFSHREAAVAYIDDGGDGTIYLWQGTPVAYVYEGSIYGFDGRHLGWFEDGYVRDHRGLKAGLSETTLEGTPRALPPKGPRLPAPFRQNRRLPPVKPVPKDGKSPASLATLLTGARVPGTP